MSGNHLPGFLTMAGPPKPKAVPSPVARLVSSIARFLDTPAAQVRLTRVSLRGAMAAVVLCAILAACAHWTQREVAGAKRRIDFLDLAASHRVAAEKLNVGQALTKDRGCQPFYRDPALADWHDRLADKYERAAETPWLPVEPDPPKP